mgnify:CR=1 FL=1
MEWLTFYLADIKQYYYVNGMTTSITNITSGVLQGSILGPILFLKYSNNMNRYTNTLKVTQSRDVVRTSGAQIHKWCTNTWWCINIMGIPEFSYIDQHFMKLFFI